MNSKRITKKKPIAMMLWRTLHSDARTIEEKNYEVIVNNKIQKLLWRHTYLCHRWVARSVNKMWTTL